MPVEVDSTEDEFSMASFRLYANSAGHPSWLYVVRWHNRTLHFGVKSAFGTNQREGAEAEVGFDFCRTVNCAHSTCWSSSLAGEFQYTHLHATALEFGTGSLSQLNDMRESTLQSAILHVVEPQIATSLPINAFNQTSTHVGLAHDIVGRRHHSSFGTERTPISTNDASAYYSSISKISKRGWMLSTSEVSNGRNGCYLPGSHIGRSDISDDHPPFNDSSAQSLYDELVQAHPKPALSRYTALVVVLEGKQQDPYSFSMTSCQVSARSRQSYQFAHGL